MQVCEKTCSDHVLSEETIEALSAVCRFVAVLYRFKPDGNVVSQICGIDTEPNGEDFILNQEDCCKGLSMMKKYCMGCEAIPPVGMSNDYHDLFVGPHKLLAAPWASVYLDEGLLYGPSTFRTKEYFSSQGFSVSSNVSEPCDHVSYEWQFMADMQERIVSDIEEGDDLGLEADIRTTGGFLNECLDPWIERFCEQVVAGSKTVFYQGLGLFTLGLLKLENDLYASLRPWSCDDEGRQ